MKYEKKIIVIVCFIFIWGMFWLLSTDRYIRDNLITIDKADVIHIVTEDKIVSCPFDEKLIDLVSYGGSIVKTDNFLLDCLLLTVII